MLTAVLELDTGAVLISTGLVAGMLGVAMQNSINDLFSRVAIGIDQPYRIGASSTDAAPVERILTHIGETD